MKTINNISRTTIDSYPNATPIEQHRIEEGLADSFESDALDGFSEMGVTTTQLKQLDKRFLKKSIQWSTLFKYSLLIIPLIIIVYALKNNPSIATKQPTVSFAVEQTDIHVPESINQLEPLKLSEQISVHEIKAFQQNKEVAEVVAHNSPLVDEAITAQLNPLPTIIEHREVAVSAQRQAKEIYLNQLKAIDYSIYRQKQSIPIEQIILTGTPANIGDEQFIQEDPVKKTVQIPYMDYLSKTLALINKGKWKQALTRLQEITNNYPEDLNARFYAGWCQYNLQDYQSASTSFSACLQLEFSNFNEEALWYLALSKKANNEHDNAKALFIQIKDYHGYYSKAAERELKGY
jgi:TolA-binding protein